ncbi:MAG: class I SAM-dependent methyltransferase [Solirubrobacterales bacterium]
MTAIPATDKRALQPAAGSLDAAEHRGGELLLHGWMMLPDDGPFERIRVRWNREETGEAVPVARPDVARALPWVPEAENSGFTVRLPVAPDAAGAIDLIGCIGGRPRAHTATLVRPPSLDSVPLPPNELAERVSSVSGVVFRTQGLKGFTDLVGQLHRYTDRSEIVRVLDWGCGCGRFTRHFIDEGFANVFGCDIDAEAIAWCQRNIARASFSHSSPDPPLPYEDGSMDVVIGCSVFTHLSRDDQDAWLGELRRVLAPGGLLLASVNGAFMFARANQARARTVMGAIRKRLFWRRRAALLARDGIVDAEVDHRLDGIAPRGYYRATYQTRAYTSGAWSRHLDVLDYVELGLLGHQDLVVMRRRPA